jgi:hypothetical protein
MVDLHVTRLIHASGWSQAPLFSYFWNSMTSRWPVAAVMRFRVRTVASLGVTAFKPGDVALIRAQALRELFLG